MKLKDENRPQIYSTLSLNIPSQRPNLLSKNAERMLMISTLFPKCQLELPLNIP